MSFLLDYQWAIFIGAEILSFACLLLFGVYRYFLEKRKQSLFFIFAFLGLLVIESVLGLIVYQHTGEFSTFLLVIIIFVLYACTFGIVDFIRLDRWMRQKISQFRNVELLTDKDYDIIERNKNPRYIAKKYRISATIHLIVFIIGQATLWSIGTENFQELSSYLTDLSWIEAGTAEQSPYVNDTMYYIGMIWSLVFIIDFLYSMSYTLFPSHQKEKR
ncbi:hypothetical protein [Alkalihalobacillus sp. LMS39]|uniref:hypothetical protein n=1 Tax=Alkalihalobacillus sp. LMS39 TaxID=2924032 RepID=UPI001FB5188B|nr:hypothetical protein [Alkalihalobacillus sp. LMS39]UOE94531.1 hypothetical protein MM271_02360 [Alkalihalobacillus sp. LMS39]